MSCGKKIYTTQAAAGVIKAVIKHVSSRDKIPKRSYYCKECKGWHLTSKSKW